MALKLSRLCVNVEKNYEMELIAGSKGLDRYVRWVHIIEDKEVPNFLSGNELIFTTGIAQTGMDWLLKFVTQCYNANASGVVLNIGPYIQSIPPHVIVFCEENGFPLYKIPWTVRLIDVTFDFCHRIIASEEREIGLATAFKNAIFDSADESQYVHVLERRGFHRDSDYIVAVVDPLNNGGSFNESERRELRFFTSKVLSKLSMLYGILYQDKKLVAVIENGNLKRIKEAFSYIAGIYLKKGIRIKVGIGEENTGYKNICESYFKAVATLRICQLHKANVMCYEQLGIYKLLISIKDTSVLKSFYNENLMPLIKYDEENGTDYVETLKIYLEQDSSIQKVAAITNFHRNTINFKIRKIKEILNCNLNTDDKLRLTLTFYIKDFI